MKLVTNETTPKQALEILRERANEPVVTRDDINALLKAMGYLAGRVGALEKRPDTQNPMDIYIGPIDG